MRAPGGQTWVLRRAAAFAAAPAIRAGISDSRLVLGGIQLSIEQITFLLYCYRGLQRIRCAKELSAAAAARSTGATVQLAATPFQQTLRGRRWKYHLIVAVPRFRPDLNTLLSCAAAAPSCCLQRWAAAATDTASAAGCRTPAASTAAAPRTFIRRSR